MTELEATNQRFAELERTVHMLVKICDRCAAALPRLTRSVPDQTRSDEYRRVIIELRPLHGKEYCEALRGRLKTPLAWRRQGCPAEYAEAYTIPEWRHRIHDQKWRYNRSASTDHSKTTQTKRPNRNPILPALDALPSTR